MSKKNCVTPKSACSSLSARWRRSSATVRRARVQLGVGSYADREAGRMRSHDARRDRGVRELAAGVGAVGRRVTAQGQDVLDAVGGVLVEERRDVCSGVAQRR